MSVQKFRERPFQKEHQSYEKSALDFPVAPEWTTGEVLLASLCRVLGLAGKSTDRTVDLELIPKLGDGLAKKNVLSAPPALWQLLFGEQGCLRSPSLTRSRFPNLSPTVPLLAAHGGVLGSVRSRWTPGNFVLACIASGAGPERYGAVAQELTDSLAVGPSDDVYARFLQESLRAVTESVGSPSPSDFAAWKHVAYRPSRPEAQSPSERFVDDLPKALKLKMTLSREEWVAVFEGLLRLAAVTHALWICHLNATCWSLCLDALAGEEVPTASHVEHSLFESHHDPAKAFLELGRDTERAFAATLERYVRARFGLNLLLHKLDDAGTPWTKPIGAADQGSTCCETIVDFLKHVSEHRQMVDDKDPRAWLREQCEQLLDKNSRAMAGKTGPPKNIKEFLQYLTRQVVTLDPTQRSYDQAYLAPSLSSRQQVWPLQPGPNILLLLVHCVCAQRPGVPSTIQDLRKHLAAYGIRLASEELESGRFMGNLAGLGLTIDSPDAYGGRILVDPFPSSQKSVPS
jgi:hypothetical protein